MALATASTAGALEKPLWAIFAANDTNIIPMGTMNMKRDRDFVSVWQFALRGAQS
jgi:hypothetical protein